jgi:hypothetical protein
MAEAHVLLAQALLSDLAGQPLATLEASPSTTTTTANAINHHGDEEDEEDEEDKEEEEEEEDGQALRCCQCRADAKYRCPGCQRRTCRCATHTLSLSLSVSASHSASHSASI